MSQDHWGVNLLWSAIPAAVGAAVITNEGHTVADTGFSAQQTGQVYLSGFSIPGPGGPYTLSFEARADQSTSLTVIVRDHRPAYDRLGIETTGKIGKEWVEISAAGTLKPCENARLQIIPSRANSRIEFRNMRLESSPTLGD